MIKINKRPIDSKRIAKIIKDKYIDIHNNVASPYIASYMTKSGLIELKPNKIDPLLKIVNKEDSIIKQVKQVQPTKQPLIIDDEDTTWKLIPNQHGLSWAIVKANYCDIPIEYHGKSSIFIYSFMGLAIGVGIGFIVVASLGF